MTTYCQLTLCAINISEWDGKVVLRFQALPIKEVWVSPSVMRCLLTVGCRSTQPLPLYHHGHTDTSAAVPEWHWWQEGARKSCQTGEKQTPFITLSFKQTWSQKPHGHQKTPTEKSSWCPPACDGWLEAAHLLAKVWLPHQGSQCEAFWQHNVRLHDIRKDKCQMGYLLQHVLKTKTAGQIHYHLPIHSFLHCGSFKRQISDSKGRQRESTSDRSFVKKCISFGSHFHPSHLNGSVPCCSLSPEGWIFSAFAAVRGKPTPHRDLPICLQASPQRHTGSSHFDGCFRNRSRHLWLVFEWQCNTRAMDAKKWHWLGKLCSTAGLQDFKIDCNIVLECFF